MDEGISLEPFRCSRIEPSFETNLPLKLNSVPLLCFVLSACFRYEVNKVSFPPYVFFFTQGKMSYVNIILYCLPEIMSQKVDFSWYKFFNDTICYFRQLQFIHAERNF